jgi:hypothetical protein
VGEILNEWRLQRRVDTIVVELEKEAIKLVDALHSDRAVEEKQQEAA